LVIKVGMMALVVVVAWIASKMWLGFRICYAAGFFSTLGVWGSLGFRSVTLVPLLAFYLLLKIRSCLNKDVLRKFKNPGNNTRRLHGYNSSVHRET
jgi:uncharacterized membrane protein